MGCLITFSSLTTFASNEWVGFWMIGGLNCTPARISLFNEISTMLPRALQGRPWYIQKSGKDKVGNRKAVVSDLI
ncbi:hypothetical protein KCU81_g9861, partial [Aureobasidium melanogenum]